MTDDAKLWSDMQLFPRWLPGRGLKMQIPTTWRPIGDVWPFSTYVKKRMPRVNTPVEESRIIQRGRGRRRGACRPLPGLHIPMATSRWQSAVDAGYDWVKHVRRGESGDIFEIP